MAGGDLPPGFVVDQPAAAAPPGLPPGFKLDAPEPSYGDRLKSIAGAAGSGFTRGGLLPAILGGGVEAAKQGGEVLDKAAYGAGGAVTDAVAKVLPPEAAAAAGFAANVGTQAIPMVLGSPAKAAAPLLEAGATKLMQSSLKPSLKALKTGKAESAVETLLDEGITISKGGVEKLHGKIDDINDAVTAKLKDNPSTIEAYKVVRGRLDELRDRVMKQVNPSSDLATVEKAMNEFLNHPLLRQTGEIPVGLAQEMKQATYRSLGGKSYGELKGADTEVQKTLARGLKEEIGNAVPGISELNAHESKLIEALQLAEHRVLQSGNKDVGGLAWLIANPLRFAAFMADRSPAFKSVVARMMHSGSEQIPATAARAGVGAYEAETQNQRGRP